MSGLQSFTLLCAIGITACGTNHPSTARVANHSDNAPVFQSGDRFQCYDDVAGQELTAKITDIGDQSGYVRIQSSHSSKFYGTSDVVAKNSSEGFSFTMLSGGQYQEELVIHIDTALAGEGTGYYADRGDSRGVDCKKLGANQRPVGTYAVSSEIFTTSLVANPNVVDPSYISVGLPFAPANLLKQQIERSTGLTLIDRGEAHITVLTPPEMQVLTKKLSKEKIVDLIGADELQTETFNAICLGRGRISNGDKKIDTYFVVTASKSLVERRNRVEQAFIAAGGSVTQFSAKHYFPHITLGYTDRDLHESDGIIKDKHSCVAPLQIVD